MSSQTRTLPANEQSNHLDATSLHPRKRASDFQYLKLQSFFDMKQYPTKEERHMLALDIEMEYKTVTTWFQNKRQAERRKEWTRNDRARKRALAKLTSSRSSNKSDVSLDHVASLLEGPSNPAPSGHNAAPLTPKKLQPPSSSNALRVESDVWRFMPSSPIPGSSPPASTSSFVTPEQSCSKSLEWACDKARHLSKTQHCDKENDRTPMPRRTPGRTAANSIGDGHLSRGSCLLPVHSARIDQLSTSHTTDLRPEQFPHIDVSSQDRKQDVEVALMLVKFGNQNQYRT